MKYCPNVKSDSLCRTVEFNFNIFKYALKCTMYLYLHLPSPSLPSTALHCTVLFSPLLYFPLLYSPKIIILFYIPSFLIIFYSTLLYSTLLYSTLLYSAVLHSTLLFPSSMNRRSTVISIWLIQCTLLRLHQDNHLLLNSTPCYCHCHCHCIYTHNTHSTVEIFQLNTVDIPQPTSQLLTFLN